MANIKEIRTGMERQSPNLNRRLGEVLLQVEEWFDPTFKTELGAFICDTASLLYSKRFWGWEIVRKVTGPEFVVGDTDLKSGFEGYVIHQGDTAEERIQLEASIGTLLLQQEISSHRHEISRRQVMENFLFGDQPISLTALSPLYDLFRHFRTEYQMRAARATSESPTKRSQYEQFRGKTAELTVGLPNIELRYHEGNFAQAYTLPKHTKPLQTGPSLDDVPAEDRDGMAYVTKIGIFGHPIMRVLETNRVFRARIEHPRAFYPPKGSPRREFLDDHERMKFVDELLALKN